MFADGKNQRVGTGHVVRISEDVRLTEECTSLSTATLVVMEKRKETKRLI